MDRLVHTYVASYSEILPSDFFLRQKRDFAPVKYLILQYCAHYVTDLSTFNNFIKSSSYIIIYFLLKQFTLNNFILFTRNLWLCSYTIDLNLSTRSIV